MTRNTSPSPYIPPASPWRSEIPVLHNRSSTSGGFRPHIQLTRDLQFDIVCGPTQNPDKFAKQAVFIPEIKVGGRMVPSPNCVAIRNVPGADIVLDGFGKRAAADFWNEEETEAAFLEHEAVAEDETARSLGVVALIDVSPTGQSELRDGGFCFDVSAQGIVVATAGVLAQRALWHMYHS